MSTAGVVAVILCTIVMAGFFAGSETAVVSCSKVRLRHRAKEGGWRARIVEGFIRRPERFFSVVLVGTNISVIACTAAATALAVRLFGDSGPVIATAIMTPTLLVAGEVVPKSIFLYHADSVSLVVAPLLRFFSYLLWPIAVPAMWLARAFLVVTRSSSKRFNLLSSREELIYLYRRGTADGERTDRERSIIDRVFRFDRVRAADLVVPMADVVTFAASTTVDEVIDEANKHTFSRFPITEPGTERIVGIVSLFDLLGLDGGVTVGSVMHQPFFAGENESAERLLVVMKDLSLHMAVIVGEGGTPLGIMTLENILETIVGDISNEYE